MSLSVEWVDLKVSPEGEGFNPMFVTIKEEKEMDSKKYRFEIAHVGINTENAGEAQKTAELLCSLCGFPKRETQGSCFVNEQIEVM